MEHTHTGRCGCGHVSYRLESAPLTVHCCHCSYCQRESGSAFALNAVIETSRVTQLGGEAEMVDTPSKSGAGQKLFRCPKCRMAVWSHYPQGGPAMSFVRVGTLDNPAALPPEIHIYTSTKQPWVRLPEGAVAFEEFYDIPSTWPPASLARVQALFSKG